MEIASKYSNLLNLFSLVHEVSGIRPQFFKFKRDEMVVYYPKFACDLISLSDCAENLLIAVQADFEVYLNGFICNRDYREIKIEVKKSLMGNHLVLENIDFALEDLAIKLIFNDEEERDRIFSVFSTINFSESWLIIKKNEWSQSWFVSDIENAGFIYINTNPQITDLGESLVDNLSISEWEFLFNRFLADRKDSLEFFYVEKSNYYSNNLLIALQNSLVKNDIECEIKDKLVEFYKNRKRVLFSPESEIMAERVMMKLLFPIA